MTAPSENIAIMAGGNIPEKLTNGQTSTSLTPSQVYCWEATNVEIKYNGSPETSITGAMVAGQVYFNPHIKSVKNTGAGVIQVS